MTEEADTESTEEKGRESNAIITGHALPLLKLDPDKYRDRISGCYADEERQNEVLNALWNIMRMMVDMGWGVDSVQVLLPDLFQKAGADSGKLLKQKDTQITSNRKTARSSFAYRATGKESADA